MTRTTPLMVALLSTTMSAWALEPADVRLHVELANEDYEFSAGGVDQDFEYDHSYGLRVSMIQPLNVFQTVDLIAMLGLGYRDSANDDPSGTGSDTTFYARQYALRYGFGVRGSLGGAFDIDLYPYGAVGWTHLSDSDDEDSDVGLLYELGAELDVAATFNQWQIGASVSYAHRVSEHTYQGFDIDLIQSGINFGGFVGYRF